MSVVVFGLNHKTAPLGLLERAAVPSEQIPKALASLTARRSIREVVVLSTCNRVEVYALVSRYHEGLAAVRDFVAEWSASAPEELAGHTYDYFDEGAAAHLFAVASGLDSMVVGERQIALQVKHAYRWAEAEGACGRMLHALFRQALRVAKRARSETGISRGASSMLDAGLDAAAGVLGGLDGRTAVVVGAGKIGGLAVARLTETCARVYVANRSIGKRDRLAVRHGAEPLRLDDVGTVLHEADLVVCSTGSTQPVIDGDVVAAAAAERAGRPLVLLDLAVPRDVDPACREQPGVAVVDIEGVRAAIETGRAAHDPEAFTGELAAARSIVDEEAAAFTRWRREARVEPTIAALRIRAEGIRRSEIDRLANRLAGLDEREREAVEALTKGIVNTLLHQPTVRLKSLADTGGDEPSHPEIVRDLFDLPAEPEPD